MRHLPTVIAEMSDHDIDTLTHSLDHYGCSKAMPNIYRVRNGTRWQCEWDDLTEIGAFRSRWLGRCVHRAQVERLRWIRAAIADRTTP